MSKDESMDCEQEKQEIAEFVSGFLLWIEWNYGENRSPIRFPPHFSIEMDEFICKIDLEDSGDTLEYRSCDPGGVRKQIVDDFSNRFNYSPPSMEAE